jgi:D-amino-acid dehydrogenase
MRGHHVMLVDAQAPGSGTSGGNAGVLAGSSLIPLNNPKLLRQWPALAGNRSAKLRYNPTYVLGHAPRLTQFLWSGRRSSFEQTVPALHALIGRSRELHRQWMQWAGCEHLRSDLGWLMLFRTPQAQADSQWTCELYSQYGIAHQNLTGEQLLDLEPALKPGVFHSGLWIQDASSVRHPTTLVQAYAQAFVQAGGIYQQAQLTRLEPDAGAWRVHTDQGTMSAPQVVLALGPWSETFLAPLGVHVPLIQERGQHMELTPAGAHRLSRPIHDTAAAYVLSPMAHVYRLTTGVELNHQLAPLSDPAQDQMQQALRAASESLDWHTSPHPAPWLGSRPTLPDARPMLGESSRHRGLWLALGHQHIGLSTGPASGELLAQLFSGQAPQIDPTPFSPKRWGC